MGPSKRKYLVGTREASITFATGTAGTSRSRSLQSAVQTNTGGPIFRCHTGTRNGSGVLDIDIYDSEDGLNFNKRASFTQITAAGDYAKDPGVRLAPIVRVVTILTSGTGFDDTKVWVEFAESRESGAPAGNPREA